MVCEGLGKELRKEVESSKNVESMSFQTDIRHRSFIFIFFFFLFPYYLHTFFFFFPPWIMSISCGLVPFNGATSRDGLVVDSDRPATPPPPCWQTSPIDTGSATPALPLPPQHWPLLLCRPSDLPHLQTGWNDLTGKRKEALWKPSSGVEKWCLSFWRCGFRS